MEGSGLGGLALFLVLLAMVFYICDREKCEHCQEECHHTADRLHARDDDHKFEAYGSDLWEKPKPWDDWDLK